MVPSHGGGAGLVSARKRASSPINCPLEYKSEGIAMVSTLFLPSLSLLLPCSCTLSLACPPHHFSTSPSIAHFPSLS